jgi:hypothetical protein
MKRHCTWHLRRILVARDDGDRRWDYAYQFLLQWARERELARQAAPATTQQEEYHADRLVCAGIDDPPAADPDN